MYEYRACLDHVLPDGTVILDVDLGFHINIKLPIHVYGIELPDYQSSDVNERTSATRTAQFITSTLGHAVIRLRTHGPHSPAGVFQGELFTQDVDGKDRSLADILVPMRMAKRRIA